MSNSSFGRAVMFDLGFRGSLTVGRGFGGSHLAEVRTALTELPCFRRVHRKVGHHLWCKDSIAVKDSQAAWSTSV
jgi:hypothetical protein